MAPPIEALQVSPIRLEQERGRLPYPTVTLTHEARTPTLLPAEVRYALLQGSLKLRKEAGGWTFEAQNVRADPAAKVTPRRALNVRKLHATGGIQALYSCVVIPAQAGIQYLEPYDLDP